MYLARYWAAGLGRRAISCYMRLGELRFDGDVDGGEVDAREGRAQDDVRSLGVEPEVELVARIVDVLGVVGLWVEAAAHDDDALRELGEVRIDCDGERDVGERAAGVDADLVRVRVHLADEEVCGTSSSSGLVVRLAFRLAAVRHVRIGW